MNLSADRMIHSLAVAKKMKEIVTDNPNKYVISPEGAFVMGVLHDIGYEFVNNQKDHAHKGGLLLKEQGYKYWKEIYFHGIPQEEYTSQELWLLNYADMITSPSGEYVNPQQRIDEISHRYGKDSLQERESKKLYELLKNEGW